MDTEDLLRCALLETAGLAGKQALSLDVISPLILADDDDPKSLLAGEFMGDFGGFLSEELRSSDFKLGYEAATKWLELGLPECDLSEAVVDGTLSTAGEAAPPGEAGKRGEAEAGDLSLARPGTDRAGWGAHRASRRLRLARPALAHSRPDREVSASRARLALDRVPETGPSRKPLFKRRTAP